MKEINKELLDQLSNEAEASKRLRKNYNFHTENSDPLQRFLNAIEPGTYAVPHYHTEKREVFIILRGKALFLTFDNEGEVVSQLVLDGSKGIYGVEIEPKTWHTIVSLENGTVCYELKDGPYNPENDKNFAPWAPSEDDPRSAKYISSLLERIRENGS